LCKQLEVHLRRLWDHHEVPACHRELYAQRYFRVNCNSDVLQREAAALVDGTSKVQAAMRSVAAREEALRGASADVVEAISAWRRSVAPAPGRGGGGAEGGMGRGLRAVASPSARGACWLQASPSQCAEAGDYLHGLAQHDRAVRRFAEVLELAPVGESDPFLLLTASACKPSDGKMRPPPVQGAQRLRMEAVKLVLLEDLVGSSLAGDGAGSPPPRAPAEGGGDDSEGEGQAKDGEASAASRGGGGGASASRGLRQTMVMKKIEHLLPYLAGKSEEHARKKKHRPSAAAVGAGGTKSLGSVSLEISSSWNRRRGATINTRKFEAADCALSLIPELHGLTPNSTDLLWKVKNHPPSAAATQAKVQPTALSRSNSFSSTNSALKEEGEESDAPQNRPPTVDLMRINATFRRYSLDGYVHQDDLVDCLKRLGFARPTPEWVDDAFASVTNYGVLDAGEFMLFISAYEDKMRVSILEDFQRYDEDGSERLEQPEFEKLLMEMHIEPMQHVLKEVLSEVDKDGSRTLDFDEFFDVIRLLQEREGFTKSEFEQFESAFKLFDRDKSGEMDEQELSKVLHFLGFQVSNEDVRQVAMEVDFDGTGTMDSHEFLVCMRKLREREMASLKTAMTMHDVDRNGTADKDELQLILYSVGYLPDDLVIAEVLEDLGMDPASCALTFGMLWQFMVELRKREGLCHEDVRSVHKAFLRYATGTEVGASHVAKILRFMGFSMSFEEKQHLVAQVDIDDSGALGLTELRKLHRICLDQRAKAINHAFKTYSTASCGNSLSAVIPLKAVPEALRTMGLDEAPEIEEIQHTDGMDIRAFFKLARKLFAKQEEEVRHNGGYTTDEVLAMRETFKSFDYNKDDTIQNNELVNLVKAVFPEMATDPKLRPQLKEIIRESDQDGNGDLDFDDFLRLMHTVCELRQRKQLDKERRAIRETEFSPAEVHEFRGLFKDHTDLGSGMFELWVFEAMISTVLPLGDRNMHTLAVLWREALSAYEDLGDGTINTDQGYDGGREDIDFPEFLWLMKQILATNFGNVNEKTQREEKARTQPKSVKVVATATIGMARAAGGQPKAEDSGSSASSAA